MYHIGSVSHPPSPIPLLFSVCLVAIPSFLPLLILSLPRICILRIRCVCAIAVAAVVVAIECEEEVLIKMNLIIWCDMYYRSTVNADGRALASARASL